MSKRTPPNKIQSYFQESDVVYLAGYLLLLISLVINLVDRSSEVSSGSFAAGLICIGMVLVLHILRPWLASRWGRPEVVNIAVLILMALFVLGSTWFSPSLTGDAYLLLIVVGMAFRLLVTPAAAAVTFSTVALWFLIPYYYYGADVLLSLSLALFFALAFFIAIGWLVRRNAFQLTHAQQLTAELQQVNEELRLSRQREKDLAVVEERIRLARDIHDGLGHHLTVLNVQLQAAGIQLETDPKAAAEALGICRQEAKKALEEVRRSVAVMRSSPLNGTTPEEALEKLIQEFSRNTPFDPIFEVSGDPYPLSPPVSMTCFRTVQEGLTNVQKHARDARQVSVCLAYHPGEILIRVSDDGRAGTEEGEEGYGLAGLEERAAQLGGQFKAEAAPSGGFILELILPTRGEDD